MSNFYHTHFIIFGEQGFLGRNVANRLRSHGHVQGFDLPSVDISDRQEMLSLATKLKETSKFNGPVAVVNAAGIVDAQLSRTDPELFYRVNGTAVANVVSFADIIGTETILQFSSETVYGRTEFPVDEDAPRRPLHPYGVSKLIGECLLEMSEPHKYAKIVIRIPHVVGSDATFSNHVIVFCEECIAQNTVTLFNGGHHERVFVSLDDFIDQIEAVLSYPQKPRYEAYNIAGVTTSMQNLAQMVIKQYGHGQIINKQSENQAFTLLSSGQKMINKYGVVPKVKIDRMVNNLLPFNV